VAAIDDLRKMLNDKTVKTRGPVQQSLKEMLDVYDAYKLQRSALDNLSGTTSLTSFMKDSAIVKLRELSKANENTMSAYNTLFASLLGDTNG
jgi:acetylglutamate synthase